VLVPTFARWLSEAVAHRSAYIAHLAGAEAQGTVAAHPDLLLQRPDAASQLGKAVKQ